MKQDDLRLWNFSDDVCVFVLSYELVMIRIENNLTHLCSHTHAHTGTHTAHTHTHTHTHAHAHTTHMLFFRNYLYLSKNWQESPLLLDDDSNQSLIDLGFKDGQPLLVESKSNVYYRISGIIAIGNFCMKSPIFVPLLSISCYYSSQ